MEKEKNNGKGNRLHPEDRIQLSISISPEYIQGIKDEFKSLHQEISALNNNVIKLSDLIVNGNLNLRSLQESLNETTHHFAEKIDGIEDMVGNIDYNIRSGSASNSSDSEYKQALQSKLSEYEEDLYMKLMRKYVVDSQISIYIQIAEQLFIEHDDKLEKVLTLMAKKLESIGVKVVSSESGAEFDPAYMKTGHYTNIPTNNEQLNGKVARSVTPAFMWTLPSTKQQLNSLLLKEEDVVVYVFTDNVEQIEKDNNK